MRWEICVCFLHCSIPSTYTNTKAQSLPHPTEWQLGLCTPELPISQVVNSYSGNWGDWNYKLMHCFTVYKVLLKNIIKLLSLIKQLSYATKCIFLEQLPCAKYFTYSISFDPHRLLLPPRMYSFSNIYRAPTMPDTVIATEAAKLIGPASRDL